MSDTPTNTDPDPFCDHPSGTILGHQVSPTKMWAVKRDNKPIWYCPDCGMRRPRVEVLPQ